MPTITRSNFVDQYRGKELDLEQAAQSPEGQALRDAGMDAARLAKADLNRDGSIQGTSEVGALFKEVDHFDRNGQYSSIATTNANGTETAAGKVVSALDMMFHQSSNTVSGTLDIAGSVGTGRSNREADVEAVQQRLLDLGFKIDVDGDFGPQTRNALKSYEGMLRAADDVDRMSGSIRPGSTLHKVMASPDAPKWVEIPARGVGFENDDWDGFRHGSQSLVDVIERTGRRYQENYRDANPRATVIALNDASRRNGGSNSDHATHENGLDMDIRLPTTSGGVGSTIHSPNYDRKTAFAIVEAFAQDPNVERILQSDPQIVRMARGKSWAHKLRHGGRSHQNHLHIDAKAPRSAFNS